MLFLKVRFSYTKFMLIQIKQCLAKTLHAISSKMIGTSATGDARVKVPSFQKVTFSYNMKYSTEMSSICIFVCMKMFLTCVIKDEFISNDSFQSYSSFLLRNRIMTKTTSS